MWFLQPNKRYKDCKLTSVCKGHYTETVGRKFVKKVKDKYVESYGINSSYRLKLYATVTDMHLKQLTYINLIHMKITMHKPITLTVNI